MSVEPVDEDAGGETEGDRGDGEDPEDGGHRGGLPAVVGGLGAAPPEGEEPEPGGVGGGEDRGGESGDEDQPAGRGQGDVAVAEGGVLGGDEDGFLGEEAGERGDGGEREERDGHRPEGVGDALGQPAHAGHGGE